MSVRIRDGGLCRTYGADAASCGSARRAVAQWLERRGADEDAVGVAKQVLAELFANAVTHHQVSEAESVAVRVSIVAGEGGAWVRLSVVDAGRGSIRAKVTHQRDALMRDEHGRGLMLVRAMGVRLSDARFAFGYQVVARFPMDALVRSRVCRCPCLGTEPPYGQTYRPLDGDGHRDLVPEGSAASEIEAPLCPACVVAACMPSSPGLLVVNSIPGS